MTIPFPEKKSDVTPEEEKRLIENEFQNGGSGFQCESRERVVIGTKTRPTVKECESRSFDTNPDGSFWKDLNQGKIRDARDFIKEQAPLADDMSKWKAHNMCDMYDDDLWELYKAAESSSDEYSPRSSLERKTNVCYSEANTELPSSTTGKYNYDDRNSRSTRTANSKKHGAKKKIMKHRKKTTTAQSDESSDDNTNLTKECKQRKQPKKGKAKSCLGMENQNKRKESCSKMLTSKLSGFLEPPLRDNEKTCQKSSTKLTGFLKTPLGMKEESGGRRHTKDEENLEFFRYIARNPGFFRSGTPMPPKVQDGENSAESFVASSQRQHAIDSVTAADNLFFFQTVSRSSHFYSRPSSRNAEF